ncbi:MAG: DUF1080 domain-containing protein [Prevotellaceae bacterium]|nr:DUF1080 domain-containing protein [Prevotellaceae bacterium]
MSKLFCRLALYVLVLGVPSVAFAQSITIDAANIKGGISPLIYGAGAEDVNHEIYGGLYDQRIFGEGFEEPEAISIEGFLPYDEVWNVTDGVLNINTNNHGKLVYQTDYERGSIEVEMLMGGGSPIAGFIIDVQEAGNGADNFRGYEIALNKNTGHFVFGKHDHNWQPVQDFATTFSTSSWNTLRVDFDGAKATCFLNGVQIYENNDAVKPLLHGMFGLRSYGGSASFRNLKVNGQSIAFKQTADGISGMWYSVGNGTYTRMNSGFTGKASQKIQGTAGDGIRNLGLNHWGINIDKNEPYHGVVYLRGTADKVRVALQSKDGSKEYASQEITGIKNTWNAFSFDMQPAESDSVGSFVLELASDGYVQADQVLLCTDSYPFRKDLTESFRQQKLTFLRYGGTMANAEEYMSKDMIGPRIERQPYKGHWYAYSTNGFAAPEFVEFARLIGTEPAIAINIEDNPQDVLAMLKEMEPHNLQMLEIGNEENLFTAARSAYEHYVERFNVLYDAIHKVYPDMQFINAAWWRADELATMEYVFHELDGKADFWDFHPWTETPQQAKDVENDIKNMQNKFLQWNADTKMRCAIFEENGNTHDMARALAHAYMLNNVRRSNGFVPLDSPANALQPYLQNDNGWDQGQIFFSPSSVWNQPPYYAQQMAAEAHQPLLVESELSRAGNVDVTATRSEDGKTLVIHAVNYGTTAKNLTLKLSNFGEVKGIKSVSLTGPANGENTPQQPRLYVPVEQDVEVGSKLHLNAYSYTVFVITTDEASAIQKHHADCNSAKCYDLAGRQLSDISDASIIIQNGRKILK